MATSPATIATAPNTMPAIAARGLVASPRLTRRRAISPVNSATTPRGTPISSQQVASANPPRITEMTPTWFRGSPGSTCRRPFSGTASRRTTPGARSVTAAPAVAQIPWPATLLRPRGQFPRAAEQAVQDQRPLDVAMQLVFGGEADTPEHLLAVACGGQRRLAGRGFGQQAGQVVRIFWTSGRRSAGSPRRPRSRRVSRPAGAGSPGTS